MFLVPFETAYTTPINVKRFSNQGRGKRFQPTGGGGGNFIKQWSFKEVQPKYSINTNSYLQKHLIFDKNVNLLLHSDISKTF